MSVRDVLFEIRDNLRAQARRLARIERKLGLMEASQDEARRRAANRRSGTAYAERILAEHREKAERA